MKKLQTSRKLIDLKIGNYIKQYIYYGSLMCFLNMCENIKKSIFLEQIKYMLGVKKLVFYKKERKAHQKVVSYIIVNSY